MRRSAAPSQLQGNSFKRLKFLPPGRSNPSPKEEIIKLNPDIKLFKGAADNSFQQSENDARICSTNPLPTEENTKEINHEDNSRLNCFVEASATTSLDPPPFVQTWMRRHRLVPVLYR